MNYNNNCANIVFLWINQRNYKVMVSAQQNPNITMSSNKSNTIGKIQKKSKSSSSYKENWVYDAKHAYEYCMNNKTESRSMSDEFYLDFVNDTFSTAVLYFNNEQEGFDFRNQLVNILSKYNLTYCKMKDIESKINPTCNTPRIFNTLKHLDTTLNNVSDNLSTIFEKIFNNYYETDVYSVPCEDTSLTNNELTREALTRTKEKTITKKYCACCHMELSVSEICQGYSCDYSGEKAPIKLKEINK